MTSDGPLSTVVMVERESYSATITALEALVGNTPQPRRIVLVDSGAPRANRRRLERFAAEHDLTLLRSDTVLNANEERNLAMRHVHTEYVVFIDNDSIVPPDWLVGLECCARETGAALVVPVVTWGPPDAVEIHYAGGESGIVDDRGVRRFDERNTLMHRELSELSSLARAPTSTIELHCLLANADVLRRIGPLDESLIAARDTTDLALRVAAAGGSIWLEPAVAVHYLWPKRLLVSDYPFFLARWSDEWGERSYASFNETWRLDDTSIDEVFRRGHRQRRIGRPGPWPSGWPGRVARTRFRIKRKFDLVATPLAVRSLDHRRARAAPARVVHAASWDTVARTSTRRGIGSELASDSIRSQRR